MKRIISLILVLFLLLLPTAIAAGGTQNDPVVTRSYMTDTFVPSVLSDAKKLIDNAFSDLSAKSEQMFGKNAPLAGLYASSIIKQGFITISDGSPATYRVGAGSVISGALGTTITLLNGTATTYAPNGGVIVNTSDGEEYINNKAVIPMNRYIIADNGKIGIKSASECVVAVSGNFCIIGSATKESSATINPSAYTAKYTKYAHALNVLGLFKGTNKGFDLERSATRAEALTMLIRILGEENAALSYTGTHPFNDVPSWADRYVAYGYNMGYTTGISATKFGSNDTVSAVQYLTFLLRALGYSDANGDFVWNESDTAAVRYGLLTSNEKSAIQSIFYRDQMVFTSYKALYTMLKDSDTLLISKLVSHGAISVEAAYQAELIVG